MVYIVRVKLTGSVHDVGVDGRKSLTGPGGVTFTLHETGAIEANPETSPMLKFLYSMLVPALSTQQNQLCSSPGPFTLYILGLVYNVSLLVEAHEIYILHCILL